MPTNAALKAIIDSDIRQKTTLGSITKTAHAAIEDAGLDYTDQEVATLKNYVDQKVVTKIIKRTITHLELLDIFTTPIIILPAASGKMYVPTNILVKYINNDGWSSTGTWKVLLDATQLTNFTSQMGGSTVKEQYTYLLPGNPSNTTDSFFNKNVYITSSANPTVPVNPLTTVDVYITYFEITL